MIDLTQKNITLVFFLVCLLGTAVFFGGVPAWAAETVGHEPADTESVPTTGEQDTPEATTSAGVAIENTYPITNLGNYNVFLELPKRGLPLKLLYSPFSNLVYGPYVPEEALYTFPYPAAEEINQRIIALKSTVTKIIEKVKAEQEMMSQKEKEAKNKEIDEKLKKEITEMNIHLADLYAMKYYKTRNREYIHTAAEIYKEAYSDIPESFIEQTSLNMTHVLIIDHEFATAFPIIKMLVKKNTSLYLHEINDTMLEFYYMSGRYQKAMDIIDIKVDAKQLAKESETFLVRTGDIYFVLNRFDDAAEWYLGRLKPKENAIEAENLSWLYLAESLFQTGREDKAKDLFRVMRPFFVDTLYEKVIQFRTATGYEEKNQVLMTTHDQALVAWMRVSLITEKYLENPALFTADNFKDTLEGLPAEGPLRDQVNLMMAYALRDNNRLYEAIDLFHVLEIQSKNRYLRGALNDLIVDLVYRQGMSTTNADEAVTYIRYLLALKYNLKTESPEKVYTLLRHNLNLIGLENASAELTLRIIDSSIHQKKDRTYLQLKVAQDMHEVFAYKQSIRMLDQIDMNLLTPEEKSEYYEMYTANLLDDEPPQRVTALDMLTKWGNTPTSPKVSYWIALNKVRILYEQKEYEKAMEIVTATIGKGGLESLPPEFNDLIHPLLAYRVILHNQLNNYNQCLQLFFQNEEVLLRTDLKRDIVLATLSSAMAAKKPHEVTKLMTVAKTYLDTTTFLWLEKWTQGKMWMDQINLYLDRSNLAVNKEETHEEK